jgi:hypothetical protein
VRTLVWIFAGILLVDALFVVWIVLFEQLARRRDEREIRELDRLWRARSASPARRPPVAVRTSSAWSSPVRRWSASSVSEERSARTALSAPVPARSRRSWGAALVALAVLAAIAVLEPARLGPIRSDGLRTEDGGTRAVKTDPRRPPRREAGVSAPGSPEPRGPSSGRDTSIVTSDLKNVPDAVAADPHSSTAIRLLWAPVPEAIGYVIHRSDAVLTGWTMVAEIDEGTTTYTDFGLESDTTYYYRVAALVDEGEAPPSDVVSATTPVASPPATVASASASDTSVTVTWSDVAGESGYRIERSLDGTIDWVPIGTTGQDVTAYTDGGLSPGTTYHYRVVATNEGGDSPASNVVSVTVPTQDGAQEAAPPSSGAAS